MKITEIITFTSTTTYSGNSVMGVTLVDAYSSDQIRHVAEATPVVVPIDGINNAGTQFFQGELLGEITRTDFNFSMYTYFSLSITITPGELIVVPVGTFTAKDYFLNSDATLPDQEIKSAFFWTSGGTRASASVAVPEPSSSLLIVLGAFGAIGLRRIT